EVLQNHVLEAKVFHTEYGTGVAILTGAHRFSLATNIDDLKLRRMPEVPGLQKLPSCWAVLSQDRVTIVLLAVGQDLYLLDNTSCSVVVSLSCAQDVAPACAWGSGLLGPFWGWGASRAAASCPSTRLRLGVALLLPCQRTVPDGLSPGSRAAAGAGAGGSLSHVPPHTSAEASQEIFKIASMAPGALLLEAQKEYEVRPAHSGSYLPLPVPACPCMPCLPQNAPKQHPKTPLPAASFGKCFVDKFPPESFVRMCQDLRVLNAIRDYQIGIPLTFTQYKRLTIEVLLDRLVLRRLYPLAIRICEYLRLSEIQGVSRILAHWACYKVQQKDKSDEEVAHAINQKLGDTPGISYSEIAARAYDCGRTELAIKVPRRDGPGGWGLGLALTPPSQSPCPQLLEYEPRSGEQVPLLLKMKRSKLALSKAIESGDTDLVYTVVLHLKNELNRGTFFMTLQNQPVALSLYRQ
ncbi:VPS16 protein, partial [Rhynochetos jubatus]|nr:VPS16 protein [Rhynochetos jubatus]